MWVRHEVKGRNWFDAIFYIKTAKAFHIEEAKFTNKNSAKYWTLHHVTKRNMYWITFDPQTKPPIGALDFILQYFKVTYSVLYERRERRIFETKKMWKSIKM